MNLELTEKMREIVQQFDIDGDYFYCEPFGEGHINDTYAVYTKNASKPPKRYILQRINNNVFKNPPNVMDNIEKVTSHIENRLIDAGKDPKRRVLKIVKTKNKNFFYRSSDLKYYRVYNFIENAISYQSASRSLLKSAGNAFGDFFNLLSDFDPKSLHVTITNFHNTKIRFDQLKEAIALNPKDRLKCVPKEIEFVFKREKELSFILDRINDGTIPLRVSHNDTKLNNVLIDRKTKKGLCVIDLDTVMAGSVLYDFGDGIRFGANNALEDESDLNKVFLREDLFAGYAYGFLEKLKDTITPSEIELMPTGAKLMTLECGIRFLTDYILGDVYFKTRFKEHNLIRCRNQFKLVEDIEAKHDKLHYIINSVSLK